MIPTLALSFLFAVVQTSIGTVTGRVVGENGRPLKGAFVQLLRKTYDQFGIPKITSVHTSMTDDQGEYRLTGIMPLREFYIAINNAGYQPIYFPRARDISEAASIQILPGQEIGGFDFELSRTRLATVRGQMFDALHVRQPHLSSVMLVARYPTYARIFPSYRVAEDGTFEIPDVPAGFYYLVGSRIDDDPNRAKSVLPIQVGDEDIVGLELIAAEGHDVRGHVRVEGPPIKDPFNVYLKPATNPGSLIEQQPAVNPYGIFVISGLPSGEYQLSVTGLPADFFVKSARFGSIDALEHGISLYGAVPGVLEVVVSNNGGRVEGTVVSGAARPTQYSVIMAPEVLRPGRPDLFKATLTNPDGRFTISGIAPGSYQIFSIEEFDPASYRDPAFINRFKNRAFHIKITTGELVTVELQNPGAK